MGASLVLAATAEPTFEMLTRTPARRTEHADDLQICLQRAEQLVCICRGSHGLIAASAPRPLEK